MIDVRADPADSSALRGARVASGVFLVWTAFVWVGRIRNSLADPTQGLGGPLLLSATFVLPALVLAVAGAVAWRRGTPLERWASVLLRVLAAWTVVVWAVRATDIALGGDHPAGFIVVHVLLAAVSIGLAVWAYLGERALAARCTQWS